MMNYERSLSTINGKHLMEKDVTPVRYIIDDLIPAGVHILAGSPKIGKSWLSLWLCLSVANGTDVWDFKTHKGGVLYMALEDSENRLQSRLRKLNMPVPENIHFTITAGDLDSGLLNQLEDFMRNYPDTSLIVIDTFQKIRGSLKEGTLYANDCKEMGLIKAFADKYNIAIVLVHHAKKGFELDPQDSISGTNGIAGTADTNLILKRHHRYESVADFSVSGRDVSAREMQLSLNDINCIWEKVLDSRVEKEEQRIPKLIKAFLEKEKTFVGTATELCHKLEAMFNESFTANSLGKKLNNCQFVLKKHGITYDNTRNHDKRQISLTLDLPEKEQKEPDNLMTDDSVLHEEFVQEIDEFDYISKDEIELAEGQVYHERLVMYEPEKEDSEDEYIPRSYKANNYHSEQVHKPRMTEGEELIGDTFSFKMRPEQ